MSNPGLKYCDVRWEEVSADEKYLTARNGQEIHR